MIKIHTQIPTGQAWIKRFQGCRPVFACVLGFTETGLIPGISAAGATPGDRQYTAIADAEFLHNGPQPRPTYALPPLHAGASPVLITRAIVSEQSIPVYLFNAGLPHPPSVPCIDLGGKPARCLSQGRALDLPIVEHLFHQGLIWGERLATKARSSYVILGECVVGGTTTALSVLTGLGWDGKGRVNSSHPVCNHQQKWEVVNAGLSHLLESDGLNPSGLDDTASDPTHVIAAVGDPMQITIAGMAIAISQSCGVLLAGGTQMLAVYALIRAIALSRSLDWHPQQVIVGTTGWVADDPTGDTVGLAHEIGAPLLATQLSFTQSCFDSLRAYEHGYVKEGVGAGGCAIAAHLYSGWNQEQLLIAIEKLAGQYQHISRSLTCLTPRD
jgi:uncharacterized protein (TIGR00303 family)